RRVAAVVRSPGCDPAPEDRVFPRVRPKAQAALVRQLRGGLEEDEALLRVLRVYASGEHVARERPVIELGVLAAKRQFEAGFAVLISVARPGVATGLGEHGHRVAAQGNGIRRLR